MKAKKKIKTPGQKLRLLHQYYSYTGFYAFVGSSLKKAIIPLLCVVAALFLIDLFVIDFKDFFVHITETYSPFSILSLFLVSESALGLIPPEIFIAWAAKTSSPVWYLSGLATLSYGGGIISFFIGRYIAKLPRVYSYLQIKMKKQLANISKWGGFLIVVGALLPIPFSITSMAAGIINYKFKYYLLFGLLRFVRFYVYAYAIFKLV
jgi:membrane protein YqaA with SNARE-associated domain